MNEPPEITAALQGIERASTPPRQLAREAVARYRQGSAIDTHYDFHAAPIELRQVVYDATVRFSRRRWWARLLR